MACMQKLHDCKEAGVSILSVLFFGWLFLIGGIFQLIKTFTLHSTRKNATNAVAILYGANGLLVILNSEGAYLH